MDVDTITVGESPHMEPEELREGKTDRIEASSWEERDGNVLEEVVPAKNPLHLKDTLEDNSHH